MIPDISNQYTEYTLKSDIAEPKTIFVFRNLSNQERLELLASLAEAFEDDKGNKIIIVRFRANAARTILMKYIAEIKNFGNCKTVEEAVEQLPLYAITELMHRCLVL